MLAALAAVVATTLALAFFAWPRGSLTLDAASLARLRQPSLGGGAVSVSVHGADGALIPVVLRRDGRLWPTRHVAPGTRMVAEAVFRRPSWIGWIAGRTQTLRLELTAPSARLEQRWLRVKAGAPVRVRFDQPVRELELIGTGARRRRVLPRPLRVVALGRLGDAGTVGVSAIARTWEQAPPATSVTWFPPGGAAKLLVAPKPGSQLGLDTPLRLRFSEPVSGCCTGACPHYDRPWSGAGR